MRHRFGGANIEPSPLFLPDAQSDVVGNNAVLRTTRTT